MIKKVVELWHRVVAGKRPEALDGVLADDVVFYSPIVYTPQRGKDVTTTYLRAAAQTVPGDPVRRVSLHEAGPRRRRRHARVRDARRRQIRQRGRHHPLR
jgi:hypothetical protein